MAASPEFSMKPPNDDAPDTLGLTDEEMRRLGYAVVDLVVDRLARRRSAPAIMTRSADELLQQLGGPVPEQPADLDASLALLAGVGLANQQSGDHPRYFARVPGPSSFAAIVGGWLATGFNAIAASWSGGSGTSTLELVVCDWLRQLLGLPDGTEGVLVSGGSIANLTAMAAARATTGSGAVYLTDQAHASIVRALRLLGFQESEIRILRSDEQFRMDMLALQRALDDDRRVGRRPIMVIASAGTTNTGAVDPLTDLADLCKAEGLWLHIDGAYGAPAALTEPGRTALRGIERADSLVVDPHKWLFQPYDMGCTLVRRPGALERAFSMNPEYLRDVHAHGQAEVDFRNRGPELTRPCRAARLWLTFRVCGAARLRTAIARGIALAEYAEQALRNSTDVWELVTPAQLGIVTFALRGATQRDHDLAAQALADSGFAVVTSTLLRGRSVLRLCLINPLTTEADIDETLARLAAGARQPSPK